MRTSSLISVVLITLTVLTGGWRIVREIQLNYEYSTKIESFWKLSEKASTLQQKSIYLDEYVNALQAAKLAPNNAVIFPTPDNDVVQNMTALKSLQDRMHQIEHMDETSFAYQTAIQQITAQEQGQAEELTATFEGCWYLENHPLFWEWYDLLTWVGMIVIVVVLFLLAGGVISED